MQGILLAAGVGSRFQTGTGTQQDKLLARLPNQQTVLWHSANALMTAMPNSIAVVQPQQAERKAILQDIGFLVVESKRAELGMGFAIADAVQASQNSDGWLIALADMPWVTAALIQKLIERIRNNNVIASPRFQGKRGQPVAFGAEWYEKLQMLQGDVGARDILKAEAIDWVDWHDNSIHRDVDRQQDIMF
jgi:molybdenum cofactor cytidylyltransferase